LHTSRVVYLISYFAAGDSLRSDTPLWKVEDGRAWMREQVGSGCASERPS